MSIYQQFQINRRQALVGLSFLILTACSRSDKPVESNDAFYTCTMHPFVRSKDPKATCPVCGMNLVRVSSTAAGSSDAGSVVYIAPARLLEIGAKSEAVNKDPVAGTLRIPNAAVLPTGNKFIVFLDHGSGQIEPREIKASVQPNGYYEVVSGLKESDQIFVSAIFLIDAESRIQGVLKTWGDQP